MSYKGVIIDIEDNGYIVELEDGNVALLPLDNVKKYKHGDTLINRTIEVRSRDEDVDDKGADDFVIRLESAFRLI